MPSSLLLTNPFVHLVRATTQNMKEVSTLTTLLHPNGTLILTQSSSVFHEYMYQRIKVLRKTPQRIPMTALPTLLN